MDAAGPLIKVAGEKLRRASQLWLEGFIDACCLHRIVILCRRSKKLLIRTGQCFLLNGLIFLGSLLILNSVIIPTLQWILPDQQSVINSHKLGAFGGTLKLYSFLRLGLIQLFYLFWFYPMYIFSFILSNIWYNDIAKHGFAAMEQSEPAAVDPSRQNDGSSNAAQTGRSIGLGRVVIGIGEQLYSLLLINSFFLEVYATGFLPLVGKALNFLLLSWMYAYYCFEYKWNLSEVSLDRRLDFFESNWAFFAGFVCSDSHRLSCGEGYLCTENNLEMCRTGETSNLLCCKYIVKLTKCVFLEGFNRNLLAVQQIVESEPPNGKLEKHQL